MAAQERSQGEQVLALVEALEQGLMPTPYACPEHELDQNKGYLHVFDQHGIEYLVTVEKVVPIRSTRPV